MARVGRHRARGQRRGRRRRHLGARAPSARARPARAASTATRSAAPRSSRRCSTRWRAGRARRAPRRLDYGDPQRRRPPAAADRASPTARSTGGRLRPTTVVRRIRAAEGHPGVLDTVEGAEFHLFGVHRERGAARPCPARSSPPATARSAAPRSTARCGSPTSSAPATSSSRPPARSSSPARARRARGPGRRARRRSPRAHVPRDRLHRARGRRLPALRLLQRRHEHRPVPAAARGLPLRARRRTTRVIVLDGRQRLLLQRHPPQRHRGGRRTRPTESWRNLHAIDDVVREIDRDRLAPRRSRRCAGDAAAGGVPFAMAADHVVAREDVVLNPYYQHMGGLYGSEYWTYLHAAPDRAGADRRADLGAVPGRSAPAARSRSGCSTTPFGEDARELPRPGARARRAPGAPSRPRPAGWRRSAAAARATSRSSRSASTAPRSSRARTSASSAPTAATTRRAAASSTSSAPRAPWPRRREDAMTLLQAAVGRRAAVGS